MIIQNCWRWNDEKSDLYFIIISYGYWFSGCQSAARNLGGDITLELEPGLKLEEITWKEDSLWYLTRPMREYEKPINTCVFKQSSEWGVFEGSVTVVEKEEVE